MFVSERIVFLYTVRDRSAPGAGFCSKPSISVCGPGPFGSGSLFFVWNEFLLVRLREPIFFVWSQILLCMRSPLCSEGRFCLGRHLLCLRSRFARLQGPVLVIYAVRDRFALGAGFIFAKDYCYTA